MLSFVLAEHMSEEIQANASQVQLDSCVCLWLVQLHNQFEGVCPSIQFMSFAVQIFVLEIVYLLNDLRYLYHLTIDQNSP